MTCGDHGGCETLDEIPTCNGCDKPLEPKAKFCLECGVSTEPEPEIEETRCPGCKAVVVDGAKFCGECGFKMGENKPEAPQEEEGGMPRDMEEDQISDEGSTEEEIEDVLGKEEAPTKESPAKTPVDTQESKVKMPIKKEDKPKEKTVKIPPKDETEAEEPEVEEKPEDFDFSKIDPEKEWECFGQIEPDHTECKGCTFRDKCAVKSGVEL